MTFKNVKEASYALEQHNGVKMSGKNLKICYAAIHKRKTK